MKKTDTPEPSGKLAELSIVEREASRDSDNAASPAQTAEIATQSSVRPVERLFPFVIRARILLIGKETLQRSKSRLHFVLITRDISETNRAAVLAEFSHYPVVQHYTRTDLERFFNTKGAKAIGFAKSGLAQSIYAELKEHRINRPVTPVSQAPRPPASPTARPGAHPFHRRRGPQLPGIGVQRNSGFSRPPRSSGEQHKPAD